MTKDCKKAEVPRDKRPCWKCGLPGHLGRDCRKGAPEALGNIGDAAAEEIDFFGAMEENDGFTTAGKRGRRVRQVPSTRPLAESIVRKKPPKSEAVAKVRRCNDKAAACTRQRCRHNSKSVGDSS